MFGLESFQRLAQMYLRMQRQVCVLVVRRQKPNLWLPSRSVRTKVKCCTATPSLTLSRSMHQEADMEKKRQVEGKKNRGMLTF